MCVYFAIYIFRDTFYTYIAFYGRDAFVGLCIGIMLNLTKCK